MYLRKALRLVFRFRGRLDIDYLLYLKIKTIILTKWNTEKLVKQE